MSEAQEKKPSNAWGQPISEERHAELQGILDAWNAQGADHRERTGPFDHGERLTGAEVFWLVEEGKRRRPGYILFPHLEGADLGGAHLEGAFLFGAYLKGAHLRFAHLKGAILDGADFEGANLNKANLAGANLSHTHLEHADLIGADLEGADLTGASFDKVSDLNEAVLTNVSLDQVTFDNTNLSVVDWRAVPRLGDELRARAMNDKGGKRKDRATRLAEYRAAVRANRRLAVALQANGLSEDAARYNYRAYLCQRKVLRYERRYPAWLGSWILAGLAGYGFRPGRTIALYLITLAAFATAYFLLGPSQGHVFHWYGALILSVTSFHGRGFFPENLNFESWVTGLAALEAVIGLLIEISFIATFTQRFFNSR